MTGCRNPIPAQRTEWAGSVGDDDFGATTDLIHHNRGSDLVHQMWATGPLRQARSAKATASGPLSLAAPRIGLRTGVNGK